MTNSEIRTIVKNEQREELSRIITRCTDRVTGKIEHGSIGDVPIDEKEFAKMLGCLALYVNALWPS